MPAGDPRWQGVEGGFRAYLSNYSNVTLNVVRPVDESLNALIEAARNATSSRPHAVCVWIGNPDGAASALETLSRGGATVVTMGSMPEFDGVFGHVQCSPVEAAELLGRKLDEFEGPQRSYVLLHNHGRNAQGTEVFQRFQLYASRHARLRMLKEETGRANTAEAGEAVRAMVKLFPNVGVVVTLDPRIIWEDPRGALLGPENRVATIGAPPELWPLIAAGKAGAAGCIDGEIGAAAANFAVRSLADHRKTERVVVIQPEWVTDATLADFSRRYTEASNPKESASQPAK